MGKVRGVIIISHDEIKDLTSDLDDKVVKALQNKVNTYETEINELKDTLLKKNSELEETQRKLSDLESKAGNLERLDSEIYDLKKTVTLKNDELNKLRAEVDGLKPKIAELTKNKDELKRDLAEKNSKINELTETLSEKEKELNEKASKLEKAETELSALKPTAPKEYTSEERLICPNCGARGKDLKVEEDKSKVLGYVGHSPLYSKINVCKKCGYKF
ncbi:MAG: coiled-coil domain-containing protein [Promethearchaeota archaeon]